MIRKYFLPLHQRLELLVTTKVDKMRILIPQSDLARYRRNSDIYYSYCKHRTNKKAQMSENQLYTLLAAEYKLSSTMVRKIVSQYLTDYPVAESGRASRSFEADERPAQRG